MDGQLPDRVKAERLAVLQALLTEQQAAFNAAQVGRALQVLLEKPGRKPGQLTGRSPYLQPVHVTDTCAQIGDIVLAEITECGANSLSGVIISGTNESRVHEVKAHPATGGTGGRAHASIAG
jgi:tRNA-2-methylthio-N6-dimethylallyladenosine synthase